MTDQNLDKILRGIGFFFIALVLITTSILTPGLDWLLTLLIDALGAYAIYTGINELTEKEVSFPNAYKIIIAVLGLLAVVSLSVAIISFPTSQAVENIADSLFTNTGELGGSFFETITRWLEASFEASKITAPAFWENLADIIKALGDLIVQLQDSGLIGEIGK